ncbi:MAG: minor capsid protein [Firmicutes bacterium]|nr:minor capsid protein [Bacillota bacterium]
MRDAAYWRQRSALLEASAHKNADKSVRALEDLYQETQREVRQEIESWYARFARDNQLTLAEAKKRLTAGEMEEFRWSVEQYVKAGKQAGLDPAWQKKLANASARFHISRLEAIELQIQQQIELLYGNQVDEVDELLRKVVGEGYTHTAFEVQKGLGAGWDIAALDPRKLDALLTKPWSTDHRTFRDRCWTNKEALVGEVSKRLTQGLLRGDAPAKTIAAIQKTFGVHRYKAARLVHTETTYFNAVASRQAYQDLDVEQVEIIETLDGRTCEICGDMDGKIIPLSQYEPGVTVPPYHPNCVLPDTIIASPDGDAIMRSEYSGEVVEFATAHGRRLSVTPNHIMLTACGWVRAKNLIQGDQVIYYGGWDKFIVEANPTHNDSIATVEQLFASLLKSVAVSPISVPTTAKDLKGDATENGKVDVIFINGFLRDILNSPTSKFFGDLPLIWAGEGGKTFLSTDCSLAQFLTGIGLASDGVMSGLNIAHILLSGSLTHHELIRFRRGAHYNTRLQQTALDNRFGDRKFSGNTVDTFTRSIKRSEFVNWQILSGIWLPDFNSDLSKDSIDRFSGAAKEISDFCKTFPGVVEFDNIIRVDRRFYTGHVYDISSLSTLYLCNGLLSSNCRGTTAPAIDAKWAGKRLARYGEDELYEVPADMTYAQWKEAFVDGGKKSKLTRASDGAILKPNTSDDGGAAVQTVGYIDREKYSCITKDITTDEVILTPERVQHIKDRHPGHFERIEPFLRMALEDPDYILADKSPNTGLILKMVEREGTRFQTVLRVHTSADNPAFKNSIISSWEISESRWENYIKNKTVLYKKE